MANTATPGTGSVSILLGKGDGTFNLLGGETQRIPIRMALPTSLQEISTETASPISRRAILAGPFTFFLETVTEHFSRS